MKNLYHGSELEIQFPKFGVGRKDCDYGSGFYMCDTFVSAAMWASKNAKGGFVNRYKINLSSLKVLRLNHQTEEDIMIWLSLLCANRIDEETLLNNKEQIDFIIDNYLPDLSNVDMIVGYRADDSYYQYTRAFLNNELPIELLKEAMMLGKLGLQYVLISKKAFSSIKFVESKQVEHNDQYRELEIKADVEFNSLLSKRKIEQRYLRDIIREKRKYQ